jgi:hypothetical protein
MRVKKDWSYFLISPCILMAWYIIKHKDNFNFILHTAYIHMCKYMGRGEKIMLYI